MFAEIRHCERKKLGWMDKFGDWKHADTISGWTGPGSVARWELNAAQPQTCRIELSYSCTEEAEGTEGMLALDGSLFPFPVMDSGERHPKPGRALFRVYPLAIVDLKPGTYTLTLQPTQEVTGGWIKLKSIAFVPVR